MTDKNITDLTIAGETFRVDIAGETTRPPLLLAHSLGADLTLWDRQIEALSKHFRVIRYDSRGHGGSVRAERPLSLKRLGLDALAILDALEIETAHFLGISMGGAVGQWLLLNAPHRVDRVVLANTAARFGTPESWNARIRATLADGMAGLADATMERWFGAAFAEGAATRVEAVRAVLLRTDPTGYAACCAALRDMDLREALSAVDRPVLVVSGSDDPVISDDDVALMLTRIDGAAHVALQARHIANIEAEDAFNTAIVDFLTAKRTSRKVAAKSTHDRALPTRGGRPARRVTSARKPLQAARGETSGEPTPPPSKKRAAPKAVRAAPPAKATAKRPTASSPPTPRPRSAKSTKAVVAISKDLGKAGGTKARKTSSEAVKVKATRPTVPAKTASAKTALAKKGAPANAAKAKPATAKPATAKRSSTKPVTTKPAATAKAARGKAAAATKNGARTSRTARKVSPLRTAGTRTPEASARKGAAKASSKVPKPASKVIKPASKVAKPASRQVAKSSAKATKAAAVTKSKAKVAAPARRAPTAKPRGRITRRGRS